MTSRLASLLVQEGLVAPKQVADAFQRQVIYGGTLDTILLEMNAVTEPQLASALARASALPSGETPSIEKLKSADALTWFPAALAEKFRAVPLSVEGQIVRVLTIDPPDRRGLDELGLQIGRAIEATIAPEHRFVHAMSMVYDTPVPARFQSLQARLLRRAQTSTSTSTTPSTSTTTVASMSTAPSMTTSASATTSAAPSAAAPVAPAAPSPFPTRHTDAGSPVVTDLPLPGSSGTGVPVARDEQLTPRLTPREIGAPAVIEREVATVVAGGVDPTPLKLDEATAAIDAARDRDEIFAALCRGARSRAEYVALFTVHAEMLVGRIALADTWIDRQQLSTVSMSLDAPTPLRTAALSRSPLVGKVGEDPVSRAFLERIGRKAPMLAALVPIVLRDRTVALLYADVSGRAFAKEAMGELSNGTTAAARAFQRLILQSKGQDYRAAAPEAKAKVDSRLHSAKAGALTSAASENAWKSASPSEVGRLHDAQTAKHAVVVPETDTLFASVEHGDDQARVSADQLVALGDHGAELTVARMPGPIRLDRHAFGGHTPPLADHGPLCSLIARFGPTALPWLERRVQDENVDVRYYATLALGELAREQALPHLSLRLFDRDPYVRRVAVEAIARMPASEEKKSLVESLRGELPGPERDRQQKASEALGGLSDAESIPRLIELVKHDDTAVQSAARAALLTITKQDFGTSRWRWRGWWDRHKNEQREDWLFEGLAHAAEEVRASAADELKRKLGESFGYHYDAPKKEREEARKKWIEWYRSRR